LTTFAVRARNARPALADVLAPVFVDAAHWAPAQTPSVR
jgi:hypothetical protein